MIKYLRHKRAKGRDYWYFDAGKTPEGQRDLIPLPHIKNPSFGGALARAQATRTNRKNRQGVLTLEGLIRLYERSPKFRAKKESTRRNYAIYLAKADRLVRSSSGESPPARMIERSDILALRDKLADTPGAANQTVRALGAMFAWAADNEKVKASPVHHIELYKSTPHEPWPEALLEEAITDPQVGMPVALLYFTGQRINEAIKMSWADIEADYMRVYVQKKDNHIRVAILPELAAMLEAQERSAVTVLTNANGRPWTQGGLRQKLQEWAKARGHHVVPHGLRKNAVISLLEAGCTTAEVSGITDQTLQMVEHYGRKANKLTLGRAAIIKLDAHRKARNRA